MRGASVVYCVSFVLFGTMIFLKLFIGIIMNGLMEESQPKTGYLSKLYALEEQLAALQERIKCLRQASLAGAHSGMSAVMAAGARTVANSTFKEMT